LKTICLLCGAPRSGKTNTLKAFFGVSRIKKLEIMQLLKKDFNGKKVYAFSLTSPQELAMGAYQRLEENGFCRVEKVKPRIEKRIKKCEKASHNEKDILVVPFTMFVQEGKVNEKCITEPIEWLVLKGFEVFVVYLRKDDEFLHLRDELMKKISTSTSVSTIESIKDDYNRQAKELETIIKKHDC
jgi:hypothetical protein